MGGADGPPTCYDDIDQADVVLIIGSNMAEAHPVTFDRLRNSKKERPEQQIIVVDPSNGNLYTISYLGRSGGNGTSGGSGLSNPYLPDVGFYRKGPLERRDEAARILASDDAMHVKHEEEDQNPFRKTEVVATDILGYQTSSRQGQRNLDDWYWRNTRDRL